MGAKIWWRFNERGEPQCYSIEEMIEHYGGDEDMQQWRKDSVVRQETIGNVMVSTVLMKISFVHEPTYETMTFPEGDVEVFERIECRCTGSREQAEAMHDRVCRLVREKQKQH